jgi:DNA topoisomerase-2
MGGKDSASERYIFTQLNPITKYLYNENDAAVLNYLDDDGTPVEPEFYAPIIPMILVNGSKGIGTGFSTEILNYNPLTLIDYIQNKISGGDLPKLVPYYDGFKGKIESVDRHKYLISGNYEIIKDDIIRVTELPVGMWTQDFKDHLETLMETTDKKGKKKTPLVKDYNDMSTDTVVDFTITLQKGMINKMLSKTSNAYGTNDLENKLKLITTKSTSNLHLFDHMQRMRKFEKVEDIVEDYFPVRLLYYQKRKDHMIARLEREVMVLHNKARFIEEQCEDNLDLRRKKKDQVTELLTKRGYDKINGDEDYKYLVSMPMSSVMEENITKLRKERDDKIKELEVLKDTSIETMWNRELEVLKKQYELMIERRRQRQSGEGPKKRKIKLQKKK